MWLLRSLVVMSFMLFALDLLIIQDVLVLEQSLHTLR
jgi:hypothetical protein